MYYINNCLELVKSRNTYVIQVKKEVIPGSFTSLETLIRILEYGTNKIPSYPLILRVFRYCHDNRGRLINEFMKESFMK